MACSQLTRPNLVQVHALECLPTACDLDDVVFESERTATTPMELDRMLTFMPGETRTSLTFSAAHDDVDDDEESVKLGIGSVPAGVTRGNDGEATVTIVDDPTTCPWSASTSMTMK